MLKQIFKAISFITFPLLIIVIADSISCLFDFTSKSTPGDSLPGGRFFIFWLFTSITFFVIFSRFFYKDRAFKIFSNLVLAFVVLVLFFFLSGPGLMFGLDAVLFYSILIVITYAILALNSEKTNRIIISFFVAVAIAAFVVPLANHEVRIGEQQSKMTFLDRDFTPDLTLAKDQYITLAKSFYPDDSICSLFYTKANAELCKQTIKDHYDFDVYYSLRQYMEKHSDLQSDANFVDSTCGLLSRDNRNECYESYAVTCEQCNKMDLMTGPKGGDPVSAHHRCVDRINEKTPPCTYKIGLSRTY